jgi:capsular polysaccharide biosynthesis protein
MPGLADSMPWWLPWRRIARARRAPPAGTVRIADVAEQTFTIETCAHTRARFAATDRGIRRARDRNPFLNWSAPAAKLRGYRLRDVVLDRSLMVWLKNGRVIAETNYLQSPESIAAARVRPESLVRPAIDGAVTSCFDHWDINYYHWLAHSVPTVHAVLQRHPRGGIGLVTPRMTPWQQQSLAMLGAADLPCVATDPGTQYWFAELEYYDYVAGRADYAVSAFSRAAYARMGAGITPPATAPRKLYIDRTGSSNRAIPNEAALVAALAARGFHIVRPEALDPAAQVALFRGAGLVVGQIGAGLGNIAFCAPGAVVYEIVPSHHVNPCFVAMCLQGGLEYWADKFATGVSIESHTESWRREIDIAEVLRRVEELEALMPADRRG